MNANSNFVGRGSYGCVYRPPMPCKNKKPIPNTIGKIFANQTDEEDEKDAYSEMDKINTNNEFTPKSYGSCFVADKLTTKEKKELQECDLGISFGSSQFIMEDGGSDLDSSNLPFFEVLKNAGNIFEGLVKMEQMGFSHNDIKGLNIVYNKNTGRLLLIDFGLMTRYKDILEIPYNYLYPYYPPEFDVYTLSLAPKEISPNLEILDLCALLNILHDVLDRNYHTVYVVIEVFINNLKTKLEALPISVDRKKQFENILNSFGKEHRRKILFDFLMNDMYAQRKPNVVKKYFINHANKIDVYSFGITLLLQMIQNLKESDLKIKNFGVISKTLELISMMINPNPEKRSLPKQASEYFNANVLPLINKSVKMDQEKSLIQGLSKLFLETGGKGKKKQTKN